MRDVARVTWAVVLALACLAPTGASARWRHHHGYLTIRRSAGPVLPGYHCPLGQYWRPSLRACQWGPYAGGQVARLAEPPLQAEPPLAPPRAEAALPPVTNAGSGRRTVDTDTRVVDRRRQVTRDGVLVTYEVRTRVTERYRRDGAPR